MTEQIMKGIARLLDSDTASSAQKTQLHPVLRLLGVFACILFCALSRNSIFVIGVIAVSLVRIAMLPPRRMAGVLRPVLVPVLLTCLVLLPSVFMGHPRTMLTVALKVFASASTLALLNESVPWKDITGAFAALHMPDIFILTLDMTVRSIVLLGRLCRSMGEAVSLRSFKGPDTARDGRSLVRRERDRTRRDAAGGLLGTVFIRSGMLAERTSEAMTCRCFDGTYRLYKKHKWNIWDAAYVLVLMVLAAAFFYTQSLII